MLHWTEIGQTFDMDGPWTEFGHLIKYSNCYQVPRTADVSVRRATTELQEGRPGVPQAGPRWASSGLQVGHRWAT